MKNYRRIYHFHIPKTGGTSVNYSFFSLVGDPAEVYKIINARGVVTLSNKIFARDKRPLFTNGNFFYGFSHYPFFNLPDKTYKITCIRNPEDRLLSQYTGLLMRKKEGKKRHGFAWLGNSFSNFLDLVPPRHLNGLVETFSGGNVKQAIKNIKTCNYIINMDTMEKDIEKISGELELSLKVFDVNKSTVSYKLTPEEEKKLKTKLQKDIEFYNEIISYLK